MSKGKLLKKLLTTALVVSLVAAPLCVSASSGMGNTPPGGVVGPSSEESEPTVSAENAVEIPTTSSVTVGGKVLKTQIKGAYLSEAFPGTVVNTPSASIAAGYGLEPGAAPYARVYDISASNSPAAYASINAAAQAVGGRVIASVNLELGKVLGGKFSLLSQEGPAIALTFGIPKAAIDPGQSYAMVCVRLGGAVQILPDLDADPSTVTFETTGGLGAYAMIAY